MLVVVYRGWHTVCMRLEEMSPAIYHRTVNIGLESAFAINTKFDEMKERQEMIDLIDQTDLSNIPAKITEIIMQRKAELKTEYEKLNRSFNIGASLVEAYLSRDIEGSETLFANK